MLHTENSNVARQLVKRLTHALGFTLRKGNWSLRPWTKEHGKRAIRHRVLSRRHMKRLEHGVKIVGLPQVPSRQAEWCGKERHQTPFVQNVENAIAIH